MTRFHLMRGRPAAAMLALALAACGGGGGGDDTPPPNIGPTGGRLSSGDGRVTIDVPAGAVATPALVTLTREPGATVPAGSFAMPESIVRIEGTGGSLATPGTISFTLPTAFPATAASLPGKTRLAYFGTRSTETCDANGDGVLDEADELLINDGTPCFQPPKLAVISPGAVEVLGGCEVPSGFVARCSIGSLAARRLGILFDTEAPKVSATFIDFPIKSSGPITVAGTYTYEVNATDNVGVVRVEFVKTRIFRGNLVSEKIGTLTAPPWRLSFPITKADEGITAIVAHAYDAAGHRGSRGPSVAVAIAAPPPDTTPPSVTLGASAGAAVVGGSVTLSATAADNVAVAKVEFLRNGSKIGEDTSAPYEFTTPAFTAGDVGTLSYTARATDTAGNTADSAVVTVSVSNPAAPGVYVSPTGDDGAAGTSAAPLRTLGKAFTVAGPSGTVWLQNGVYTPTTEGLAAPDVFTGRTLPAGAALRAVNDGGATVAFTLQVPAGGSITGLNFDTSSSGRVLATGGSLTLSRPQWVKLGSSNLAQGLTLSGSAKVLMDPKGNPAHNYTTGGLTGFVALEGSAELTVDGGVLDGTTGQSGAFLMDGTAKLTLLNFTVANTSGAWVGGTGVVWPAGTANQVWLENTTIDLANAGGVCVLQDRQVFAATLVTTSITLKNATLKRCGGGSIQLREGAPVLVMDNSVIQNGARPGIEAGVIGFDSTVLQYARPAITITGGSITGNGQGGVLLNNGGSLVITGATLDGGAQPVLQLLGAQPYQLTMRNSTIKGTAVGVLLQGDAASSLDLGSAAAPGGNTLQAAPGVRVSTAAGVRTLAVGNTWLAGVQGANAAGAYTSASSVCGGANPCDVSTGTGSNFGFQAAGAGASLRLVGP